MKKNYILHIISLLIFGINGIVASYITLSSYEIVFMRTLLGSVTMLVILFISTKSFTLLKYKKDALFIAISGIFMGTSWMLLYEAFDKVGVSIGELLYYSGPVIVIILSPLIFKTKLTIPKVAGFVMVLLGMLFINGTSEKNSLNPWGAFCGVMSAVTYAGMIIFNKKAKNVSGLENSTLQLVSAFITLFVFMFFKNGLKISVLPSDILWISVLGIVNTGLGCYLFFSSAKSLSVQTVAVLGYLEPLSAIFFALLILKEALTPMQVLGAILILSGAIVAELYKTKSSKML